MQPRTPVEPGGLLGTVTRALFRGGRWVPGKPQRTVGNPLRFLGIGRGNGQGRDNSVYPVFTGGGENVARPPLPLSDSEKPTSIVTPEMLRGKVPDLSKDAQAVIDEVLRRFDAAARARAKRSRVWELCERYESGEQFWEIDEERGLVDVRDEGDNEFCYYINVIGRLVQKVNALATQNDPDANVIPLTTAPLHVAAAEEGDIILGDVSRDMDWRGQMGAQTRGALIASTYWRLIEWDSTAEALIPVRDPVTGEETGAESVPIGKCRTSVWPSSKVYLDPAVSSSDVNTAGHILLVDIRPLSWYQTTFGQEGYFVKADARAGSNPDPYVEGNGDGRDDRTGGFLSGALGWLTGQSGNNSSDEGAAAVCYRYLEKPNGIYPKGRYIIVAGGRLLYYGDWPCPRKDAYPLVPVWYKEDEHSPYGKSLVAELIDCQAIINREVNRILSRLDKDKRYILINRMAELEPDAFEEMRDLMKIYYNPGATPPEMGSFQTVNAEHFNMLMFAIDQMQEISGIVDVLQGKAPPGVTAGVSIDLLMQGAQSMLAPLLKSVERCAQEVGNWTVAYNGEYVAEERLWGIDQKANPAGEEEFSAESMAGAAGGAGMAGGMPGMPSMGAMPGMGGMPAPMPSAPPRAQEVRASASAAALRALTSGGRCAVIVTPGSSIPRSPAAQRQELMDYANANLLDPSNPQAAIFWKISNHSFSSKVVRLFNKFAEEQEAKEQAAAMAQMQAEREAQAAQQEAQLAAEAQEGEAQRAAEADKQAATLQAQMQMKEADLAAKAQAQVQADAAKAQMAGEQEATRIQGQMALNAQQAQIAQQAAQEQARLGVGSDYLRHILMPPPKPEGKGSGKSEGKKS